MTALFTAALGLGGRMLKGISPQGWLGIAGIAVLSILLVMQKGETRHWKKSSARFEQLYRDEVTAHATTVANYRVAAEKARADDAANKKRVEAEQAKINQERDASYEARIADARARADSLRQRLQAAANSGSSGKPPVPGVPAAPAGAAQAADGHRLSLDERLTATEQAIQLDELIKWVKSQGRVVVSQPSSPTGNHSPN